jgi:hypothetical protein
MTSYSKDEVTSTPTGALLGSFEQYLRHLYTKKKHIMARSSQHPDKENAAPGDEIAVHPKYELDPTVQPVDALAAQGENEFFDSAQDARFNDREIERVMKHSDDMIGKVQEIQKDKRAYWTLMTGVVGVAATFSVVTGLIKLWKWIQRTREATLQVWEKTMESQSTDVDQSEDKGRKTRRHARSWD